MMKTMRLAGLAAVSGLALVFAVPAQAQSSHSPSQDEGVPQGGHAMTKETATVSATGKVNAVNSEKRTVNLSHQPIPALGWPAMTMDMKVADDVDLSALEAETPVTVTLKRAADGIYVIEEIRPR